MRPITLVQNTQPDGSIHHEPPTGCRLGPCCKVSREGVIPGEICDMLHSDGVDADGFIVWCCGKTPCRSGA